jgi:hypothetical protein
VEGTPGNQGADGATGPTGPSGATGVAGVDATEVSLTWAGTLTAADMIINRIFKVNLPYYIVLTTATAASILGAMTKQTVASSFEFIIVNIGDGLVIIAAGAGVSFVGLTNVEMQTSATFLGRVDAITSPDESITIYRTN